MKNAHQTGGRFASLADRDVAQSVLLAAMSLGGVVEATLPLLEGGWTLGLSSVVAGLLGGWGLDDGAMSAELGVVATLLAIGAVVVLLTFGWLAVDAETAGAGTFVSALSRDGAGAARGAGSLFAAVVRLVLMTGAFGAFALVSFGGAFAALRLGASSTAVLASATTTGLSPPPFVLASVGSDAGLDWAAPGAGATDLVATSAGGRVRSSRNAPPITVAAMMPIPIPK